MTEREWPQEIHIMWPHQGPFDHYAHRVATGSDPHAAPEITRRYVLAPLKKTTDEAQGDAKGERAKHDGARWPNGWPVPTFADLDDDGDLLFEWCFGKQGARNSWRVMLCIGADETVASTCALDAFLLDVVSSKEVGFLAVMQRVSEWLKSA